MGSKKRSAPTPKINTRWLFPFLGILLVIIGQLLVTRADSTATPSTTLGKWLNNTLRLGMPGIDSVLGGLLILLVGGALLYVTFRDLHDYSPEESLSQNEQVRVNSIRSAWPLALLGSGLFLLLLLQLRKMEYHSYSPWLWILSLLIFSFIIARWDRLRGVNLSPGLTRQDLIWLLGLLIIGFLIVTYRLQGWPDQLMGDEGIFGSTARDIATGHFRPPVFAQGVDTFPVLSSIWQGWIMRIFGINIWGWRFGSVLPGVMSILPLYLFIRDAFNRRIAIISSMVLLGNPYFLVYSHLGYTNIQPVFIITITLYLLHTGLRKTSNLYLYLAGCSAGLGFYTYFSGRSAFVVAILYILLMWLTKRLKFQRTFIALFAFILGITLIAAPHIFYGISQNPQSMVFRIFLNFFNSVAYGGAYFPNAELIKYMPFFKLGETELFFNPKIYLILILRGFIQTLLPYLRPGMLWGQHYLASPLAGTVGAVFFIIGLVVILRNAKQSRFQLIILWLLSVITFLSALNTFPPREDHMVPIVPALALLIGFGLDVVVEMIISISNWFKNHKNILLIILLAMVMIGGLYDYFITGPRHFPQKPEDIMSWAGLDSQGESFICVYDVPIRPNFIPWVMAELRQDIDYRSFQFDEFTENNEILKRDQETIIFYPPKIDSQITPILQAKWGDALVRKAFINADGVPVLIAEMNTRFTFERDRTFLSTLFDAFRQTRFVIFLLSLLLLFLVVVFVPSSKLRFSSPRRTAGDQHG